MSTLKFLTPRSSTQAQSNGDRIRLPFYKPTHLPTSLTSRMVTRSSSSQVPSLSTLLTRLTDLTFLELTQSLNWYPPKLEVFLMTSERLSCLSSSGPLRKNSKLLDSPSSKRPLTNSFQSSNSSFREESSSVAITPPLLISSFSRLSLWAKPSLLITDRMRMHTPSQTLRPSEIISKHSLKSLYIVLYKIPGLSHL